MEKKNGDVAAAKKAEDREAKRKEVEARVKAALAARARRAHAEAQSGDKSKYGTHRSITCDGCGVEPIVGFRWKCVNCKNHDLCDACHEEFLNGKLLHSNRRQNVSMRIDDHKFNVHVERGSFQSMTSSSSGSTGTVVKKKKKIKPNAICPLCSSGKKYKKCCGRPGAR